MAAVAIAAGALAGRVGAQVPAQGADVPLHGVASLESAQAGQVSFLASPRYREQLAATRASAVLVSARDAHTVPAGCVALVCANPYAAFARAAQVFAPAPRATAGVHPTAVVHPQAQVHASAQIGPGVVVEAGACVGARSLVGPGCVLGQGATLGEDCRLVARVTVAYGCSLGDRVLVHPGAVIGADGFGFAPDFTPDGQGGWVKIPQTGAVRIGSDVEIGANTTIDRGALDDTVVGDGCKIDNLVQIAHNVRIGAHTAIAACVGIAGSAVIGSRCMIGGGAGILGHLTVPDGTTVSAMTLVPSTPRAAGFYTGVFPLMSNRDWERAAAALRQLPELRARLRALERDARGTDASEPEEP